MTREAIRDTEYHPAVIGFSDAVKVKVKAEGIWLFVSGLLTERRAESKDYPWYESVLHEDEAIVLEAGNIEVFEFDGRRYVFYLIELDDYREAMVLRSPKWQTVTLTADGFREYAREAGEL